jgi:hypothetical protein
VFSGLQEIAVVVLIVLGILILPRLTARKDGPRNMRVLAAPSRFALTGRTRLAIAISVLWPLLTALHFEPWHEEPIPFLCWGLGPVLIGWAAWWISAGFRKK